jgi:hypothetical protein
MHVQRFLNNADDGLIPSFITANSTWAALSDVETTIAEDHFFLQILQSLSQRQRLRPLSRLPK